MTRDEIEDVVCEIMMAWGPDGHVDGSDVITSFMVALLAGTETDWLELFRKGGASAVLPVAPSNAELSRRQPAKRDDGRA